MKVSVPVTCPACNNRFTLDVLGGDLPECTKCPKCGAEIRNMWPLGNAVAILLMERAKQELADGDVTITILLSSMAVEGEMAFLYFKWKSIDENKLPHAVTEADRKKCGAAWKDCSSFKTQLDAVSKLLSHEAFDAFSRQNKTWLFPRLDGFDRATSIKQHFQDHFYSTRIRVVHYGEVDLKQPDGERCFSLAWLLLKLFHAMDRKACELLDEGKRIFNSQPAGVSGVAGD